MRLESKDSLRRLVRMSTPVEDFLNEDPEIAGQKFCLLSFLSPENVLANKDMFFIEHFLKDYEIQWKTKYMEKFVAEHVNKFNAKLDEKASVFDKAGNEEAAELCRSNRLMVAPFLDDYQAMLQKNKKEITQTKLQEDYKDFLFKHQADLEDKFHAKNDFRTTVRGLKVRGVAPTYPEAAARAKKLQKQDPIHNIFVGEIGKWLPWDPSPNAIQEQEYAEEQLNQLMKRNKDNDDNVDNFYRERNIPRPDKKVIGVNGAAEAETTAVNEIFGGPGDLAIQRKIAAAEAPTKPVIEVLSADAPIPEGATVITEGNVTKPE
jgi:hypothetical protein